MYSATEENYLKAIYSINSNTGTPVPTNDIASLLDTKPSSVTDMIKKLKTKKLVNYQKYKGVILTEQGNKLALQLIRKHRLWEVFLVEKLNFKWDEVHEVAEELEHIKSPKMIDRLDKFLEFPKKDPHGDPIPDKDGNIENYKEILLSDCETNRTYTIIGVKDTSKSFLQYLDKQKLILGTSIKIINQFEYDNSVVIEVNNEKELTLSNQVCKNIYVK